MSRTGRDALESNAIDAQYDPSLRVFSRQPYMDWYVRESLLTREKLTCRLNVAFGPTPAETLDIFPSAKPNSPVLMFIHGGYWRALSSKEFSYVAGGLVPHDITVVVINHALCPEVSIADITAQSRTAVAWLARNARHYNGNPEHIVVAGHSAGGHQVGMLLSADRTTRTGADSSVLKGGIAISGLFDIRPLQRSWLQPILQLTDSMSAEQSPLLHIPSEAVPLLLSVGGDETDAFKSQSQHYLVAWRHAGLDGDYFAQPGLNHYESIYGFADPASPLSTATVDFIERCVSSYTQACRV